MTESCPHVSEMFQENTSIHRDNILLEGDKKYLTKLSSVEESRRRPHVGCVVQLCDTVVSHCVTHCVKMWHHLREKKKYNDLRGLVWNWVCSGPGTNCFKACRITYTALLCRNINHCTVYSGIMGTGFTLTSEAGNNWGKELGMKYLYFQVLTMRREAH